MNIAFASSKGGVGKSTACAAIAALLATRGDKVLILDLDQNQTLARWAEKIEGKNPTVVNVDPSKFTSVYRSDIAKGYDHILMDLAGAKEDKSLIQAMGRSHLVIVPAQLSEPDLNEALVIISDLADVNEVAGRQIPYRVLFNRLRPLGSRVDKFILDQAHANNVAHFETMWLDRVAYREMLLNGVPPHVREESRGAGPEVQAILDEIETIVATQDEILKAGAA